MFNGFLWFLNTIKIVNPNSKYLLGILVFPWDCGNYTATAPEFGLFASCIDYGIVGMIVFSARKTIIPKF